MTLSTGICENAALHKSGKKKIKFKVALFLSESHCYHSEQLLLCTGFVSSGVQGPGSFVYTQIDEQTQCFPAYGLNSHAFPQGNSFRKLLLARTQQDWCLKTIPAIPTRSE